MAIKYKKGTFTIVPNIDTLKGKSPEMQSLFLRLCSYANNEGGCFPSRTRLAKECGMSVKTVDRYMKLLVEENFILKELRKVKNTNQNLSNYYTILVTDSTEEINLKYPTRAIAEVVATIRPYTEKGATLVKDSPLGSDRDDTVTISKLTKSNLTKIISPKGNPIEIETNRIIELFGLINKDWRTFFQPGPQRTSVQKLIKFAKEDNLNIGTLIQMAKDAHGVEFAPQIFTPTDLVAKYTKLIAYNNKSPQKLDPSVPYKKGKYLDDKSLIG